MYIPSAHSKISVIILLIIAIGLFLWVHNSRVWVKEKYYDEKLLATELTKLATDAIREYRIQQGYSFDELNDPNRSGLIGEKYSLITTDRGDLTAKLTTLNPNISAIIVEFFKKAKLKEGDVIAINVTGSMPALNIAVLSAANVLGLDVVLISSVGASMFGATDPYFTWLDMETLLNEKDILHYKSVATSLGGGRDLGRGLSKAGRDLIIEAAERNNVDLIQEKSLEKNIERKMQLFRKVDGKIQLYVNIGGGLSSLGDAINGRLLPPGLHKHVLTRNIPKKGTMFLFAEKGVPVIHLLDVRTLAEEYDLPISPVPLPEPGTGAMFLEERYNLTITAIALAILAILIVIVIFFDKRQQQFKEEHAS
ncbi:MAG: poly-gamma-glutamate system protein [Candidatus Cloacimonetes bacterium]|nr:poly-gamma-glutamate system protein [Candidatus Cloacimonadota bacterium]